MRINVWSWNGVEYDGSPEAEAEAFTSYLYHQLRNSVEYRKGISKYPSGIIGNINDRRFVA